MANPNTFENLRGRLRRIQARLEEMRGHVSDVWLHDVLGLAGEALKLVDRLEVETVNPATINPVSDRSRLGPGPIRTVDMNPTANRGRQ